MTEKSCEMVVGKGGGEGKIKLDIIINMEYQGEDTKLKKINVEVAILKVTFRNTK